MTMCAGAALPTDRGTPPDSRNKRGHGGTGTRNGPESRCGSVTCRGGPTRASVDHAGGSGPPVRGLPQGQGQGSLSMG